LRETALTFSTRFLSAARAEKLVAWRFGLTDKTTLGPAGDPGRPTHQTVHPLYRARRLRAPS
ncbi:MAG: hypothetical protein WAO15_03295, partial [Mycobacterium sp.]